VSAVRHPDAEVVVHEPFQLLVSVVSAGAEGLARVAGDESAQATTRAQQRGVSRALIRAVG
jgi:hypothetical protein